MIQEKVESMDGLINGILEYSSIREDLAQRRKVDLNDLVCQIREMIYVPDHIKIIILKPLPCVEAVPAQMHQLFQNLLSNAVTHIDKEEGLVEVDFEKSGDYLKFSIRDNGVGISPEYHDKIFEIFESFGTGGGNASTGIGLSIVNKIVGIYEGNVWVESEVDQGTTFHFTLKI
jgi:signal transduction histidine kinase